MEADLWWTRVKIDLYQKKLLRWVIPTNGIATGETTPNADTDPEGYIHWAESYLSVEATLHLNLKGMLEVVIADPRYIALGEFGRILDRVRVIREVYADYDLSTMLLEEDDEFSSAVGTQIDNTLVPSSQSTNTAKRPAPSSSLDPNSKIPKLTPTSLPRSTALSAPPLSSIPFDRVYRAPSRISNETRRLRCKAVMEANTWGQRCSICGIPNGDGGEHRTYACTDPTFATTNPEPVLIKMIQKPTNVLVVMREEKEGWNVCYAWNTRRTKDGRCHEKDCKAHHCCSLCLSDDHRAWDCDKREYIPKLPPRPDTMVPANVDECWKSYSGTRQGISN